MGFVGSRTTLPGDAPPVLPHIHDRPIGGAERCGIPVVVPDGALGLPVQKALLAGIGEVTPPPTQQEDRITRLERQSREGVPVPVTVSEAKAADVHHLIDDIGNPDVFPGWIGLIIPRGVGLEGGDLQRTREMSPDPPPGSTRLTLD